MLYDCIMKIKRSADDLILLKDFLIKYKITQDHIIEYLMKQDEGPVYYYDIDYPMNALFNDQFDLKTFKLNKEKYNKNKTYNFWVRVTKADLYKNIDVNESEHVKSIGGGFYPIYNRALYFHLVDISPLSDNFIVSPDPIDFYDNHYVTNGQYIESIPKEIKLENIYVHNNLISEFAQTTERPYDIKVIIKSNFDKILIGDKEFYPNDYQRIVLKSLRIATVPQTSYDLLNEIKDYNKNLSDLFRKDSGLRLLIKGFGSSKIRNKYSASDIFRNAIVE